jgi:glycosyltransferase involved in cell wall biosynthesis
MRQPEPTVKERWGTGDVGGDGHIDGWCWSTTCQTVHRVARRDGAVAVITEYALLSKCFDGLPPSILRVIDTVELFFRNRERFQVEGLTAPFVCTPESENTALGRADVLMAIQSNDAQALKERFPAKEIITVPHTYPEGRPRSANPRTGTVLYVGSSNPFNVHGLREFLKEAWEPILTRVPDATLRVVGSVASTAAPGDSGGRQVVYVGRVSDEELAREYETTHVVINPQVAGTGLKIKCVEALSAGCPVVMNQAGADGLEEGAESSFLVAKDWAEFSGHVVRILTDPGLRRRLEAEARRFAARMFSPEATYSELERSLTRHRNTTES